MSFTFHNVSINTENPEVRGVNFQNLKFHDISINTMYQKEKERSLQEAETARKAMVSLSAKQKELVMMLYGPDPITVSEYAAREGVSQPAISNRLKKIRIKLKKIL